MIAVKQNQKMSTHFASTPSGVVAYVKAATDTTANTSQNSQVYYFYDNRPGSQQGWGAMSISPAGRLKKWYWTGSVWAS
jgi:hypothetical protein